VVTNTKTITAAIVLIGLIASCAPAHAQQLVEFQFGVRAGVPVTDFLESNTPQVSRQETFDRAWLVAGSTFGAVLRDRLLVQVDALYKRVRGRSRGNLATAPTFEYRAASFEFPVLFDYYLSKGSRRPFAGGGIVAGHVITGTTTSHAAAGTGGVETPFEGQFSIGNQLPAFVANGGVEWKGQRLVIRPEIRYTRWGRNPGAQIRRNQLEISIGFSLYR
jgi:hypothetical protein